ncbi:MAG TPA: hypothetical protein VLA78_14175, partial [Paracoccaceae bacterium]|nr:hypothetical protein [Paracoccaceae bacterium]
AVPVAGATAGGRILRAVSSAPVGGHRLDTRCAAARLHFPAGWRGLRRASAQASRGAGAVTRHLTGVWNMAA